MDLKAVSALALAALLANLTTAYAASFHGLGDLPGGPFQSSPIGLSSDGRVVVGIGSGPRSNDDDLEAFRWSATTGIVSLGYLEQSDRSSWAYDVSHDGDIVIGNADGVAFRWTAATGMQSAGLPPGAIAYSLSDDGQTAVGSMNTALGRRAMRWTASGGAQALPALPGNLSGHVATAVSADGSVVAGFREENSRAFYWTQSSGTVELPIPTGALQARTTGISADGSTIAGRVFFSGRDEAIAWRTSGEIIRLPGPVSSSAQADAVSGDGSIVVGYDDALTTPSTAFIWDAVHGKRSLHEVLTGFGVDLAGWRLAQATGISADGLTIIGYGQNPNGFTEAWIATVPEPSTMVLAMAGCLAIAISYGLGARSRQSNRVPSKLGG